MRNAQTAEPRSDDRSMRRIELPSVWPNPRSSGWRRNSATFGLSSRLVDSTRCGRTSPRRSMVGIDELGLAGCPASPCPALHARQARMEVKAPTERTTVLPCCLHAAALGRPAPVVRDRRDVLDGL